MNNERPSLDNQVWGGDQEADQWPFRDVREACWVCQVELFLGVATTNIYLCVYFDEIDDVLYENSTTLPQWLFVKLLKRKLCSKRWRGGLQSEMAVFGSLLDTEMERGRESRSRVRKQFVFSIFISPYQLQGAKKYFLFQFCLIPRWEPRWVLQQSAGLTVWTQSSIETLPIKNSGSISNKMRSKLP